MSESSILPVIPEEILSKAANATENLLPKRYRELYNKEYEHFDLWLKKHQVETINETILLGYFDELSETFAPNSLWTKYSMLKKTLLVMKNVDIAKYYKLGQFLKQENKGYEPKKSKVLTREEVLKFIQEAPNKSSLLLKVALLFGVFGGCRRQELVNMMVDHIEDRDSVIIVNIPETKTDKKRVFTIIDEKEINSLALIREYVSLRPKNCTVKRFFLNYRNGRCTSQPVGKNSFGKIPATIAQYLGLKNANQYTGHCLRRTSATLLADAGANMTDLKRHGGWKSTTVAEGYLEDSIYSKNKISAMLAGVSGLPLGVSVSSDNTSNSQNNAISKSVSGSITFTGTFQNCNFNVKKE